jgi:hypothetical protein
MDGIIIDTLNFNINGGRLVLNYTINNVACYILKDVIGNLK